MSRGFIRIALTAALCLTHATAWAGPVELLNKAYIDLSDPNHLVVSYIYGGNGMFVSTDGGKTLKWICGVAMDAKANARGGILQIGGDGAIYFGSFFGLLRGDKNGCGFQPVPELENKYIGAISGDPIDPKRTYVATTTDNADNGIYMDDGSGTFAALGRQVPRFIETLDVVKIGDKRRFYETTGFRNVETNIVSYFVQTSDDDGATWTEDPVDLSLFPPIEKSDFSIVAINPANPDQVVAVIKRNQNVDSILFSDQKGKAGSWKAIAEVTELGGAAFTSEGALYLGDNGQQTKGLTVVAKPGDQPRKLNEALRVSCLMYEASSKRLLGCATNYLFGSFDLDSGVLTPLLDLRCATDAVECEGWTGPAPICKPDAAEFCRFDHWVVAPVCLPYDRGEDCIVYASMQTVACVDGRGVEKATPQTIIPGAADTCATLAQMRSSAGAAGTSTPHSGGSSSGSAGGAPGSAGAGGSGDGRPPASAGSASKAPEKSGGCQCSAAGNRGGGDAEPRAYFSLMGLALIMLRVRRSRVRSRARSTRDPHVRSARPAAPAVELASGSARSSTQ